MRATLAHAYGVRKFDLPRGHSGFSASWYHVAVQSLALSYCRYAVDTCIEFPTSDCIRQPICLSGAATARLGSREFELSEQRTCILPPNAEVTTAYQPDYAQLVLRFETAVLERKLAALLGFAPSGALSFEQSGDFHQPEKQALRRLLLFFASEMGGEESAAKSVILEELSQSIIVAFLLGNRHNFSHLLGQPAEDAAPWQVRRAENYIEAHWNQPLTIEQLCEVTSASARSIFHWFRKTRGYSPMDFLKIVRLSHARRMLSSGDPATSVKSVVFACRFSNMGHFARDYRAAFGELPSETLNRARGTRLPDGN